MIQAIFRRKMNKAWLVESGGGLASCPYRPRLCSSDCPMFWVGEPEKLHWKSYNKSRDLYYVRIILMCCGRELEAEWKVAEEEKCGKKLTTENEKNANP